LGAIIAHVCNRLNPHFADLGSFATTIAIAIAPGPKPNDDHSNASDLATSASAGGHRRVAVDASC
jgi:hypothetical protein